MKATVKHIGYAPIERKHQYFVIFENGHVDMCFEEEFISDGEVEVDYRLWDENSGWGNFECDLCHYMWRDRVYRGMIVSCPVCGNVETVPIDAQLEESNLE